MTDVLQIKSYAELSGKASGRDGSPDGHEDGRIGGSAAASDRVDLNRASADYARVRRAIQYLSEARLEQPQLADLAAVMGVSATQCQKIFMRWCGLSPKAFVAALTLDHARQLLRGEACVLGTSLDAGLSSPSRLHDLFMAHETMPPGVYRAGCPGLTFCYGVHPTPFGMAVAVIRTTGELRLAGLAFVDDDADGSADDLSGDGVERVVAEFQARWPKAAFCRDDAMSAPFIQAVFAPADAEAGVKPVRVVMIGTDFELRVWERLVQVPRGAAVSYKGLAEAIESPKAARAVGRAVGRNPLSFVVPCHRVLQSGGGLGGYHWGLTRKRALIGWEAGKLARR
ncbi:MAG: bifunctional helix-turn-helix domain-containing protein/methylated-DNA--[protein]-cysteine S-methyltransferase [Pseudomonadota bacterium]